MKRKKRIGVFGGSFNPIHKGHLEIAQEAMDACGLDEVRFIPAGDPYMKDSAEILPAKERLRLAELAVEGYENFMVDPLDVERDGPSYTVDTLESLSAEFPGSRLYLIVGEDAFRQMPLWKAPERIAELAEIIVAGRKCSGDVPDYNTEGPAVPVGKLHRIACEIDISSTDIRRRIWEGISAADLLPDGAAKEIVRVYREFLNGKR